MDKLGAWEEKNMKKKGKIIFQESKIIQMRLATKELAIQES